MDNGKKRAILVWHRRAGKDKSVFNFLIKKAFERIGTYYYIFPTYNQGRKIIWDGADKNGMRFLDHIPEELIVRRNEQEMKIELANGSIIQIIGSDNVDNIVGTNPIGVIFSEYSLQKPQAWEFIRPILAENEGWAVFVFTPRGMNHGWKILQQAKEAGWFWQILTVDDTGAIKKEVIEEEKKQMPSDLFEQEYYCKFIEGAGQFFRRIDNNVGDGKLDYQTWKKYKIGVDLGKYQDFTVITVMDLHTFKIGEVYRFNQMDWNLQKAKIEAIARKWNNAEVYLDSTGLGDPIHDDLANAGLNVVGFKFTEGSRKDLLNNLSIKLEQDKIIIPPDDWLIDELKSLKYELTDRGKLRIQVPDGLHDDGIMSLALCVWEMPENPLINQTKSLKHLSLGNSQDVEIEKYT